MSKYEKLDAMIRASIDETPKKFALIDAGQVRVESERIAKEESLPTAFSDVVAWRIVERRLQALRKAGKIRSTTMGWIRT